MTWTSGNAAVATLSGSLLTIVGAGTATLTATQTGNDSYLPFLREFALTVKEPTPGDTNNDGTITMEDATAIVNHILGKSAERFYSKAADVNHDGKVSIADVTLLIDSFLTKD